MRGKIKHPQQITEVSLKWDVANNYNASCAATCHQVSASIKPIGIDKCKSKFSKAVHCPQRISKEIK